MTTILYPATPPHRRKITNFCNQRFGRLHVIGYAGIAPTRKKRRALWLCKCDCGKWMFAVSSNLTRGTSVSCGCWSREKISQSRTIDGEAKARTVEYRTFHSAKARCESLTDKSYDRYGALGVKFLFESYAQFLAVMGRKPTPQHSLDRYPDPFGNYEPSNCRWATPTEQQRNRRVHTWIEANGIRKRLAEWAESSGISRTAITGRIQCGWCNECAVTIPVQTATCVHKT